MAGCHVPVPWHEKPLTKCVNLVSGYVGWRTCLLLPVPDPWQGMVVF